MCVSHAYHLCVMSLHLCANSPPLQYIIVEKVYMYVQIIGCGLSRSIDHLLSSNNIHTHEIYISESSTDNSVMKFFIQGIQ